ncbi:MAG: hypothetical protein ACFB6R_07520 [Alphaproteobacteria bacterium]
MTDWTNPTFRTFSLGTAVLVLIIGPAPEGLAQPMSQAKPAPTDADHAEDAVTVDPEALLRMTRVTITRNTGKEEPPGIRGLSPTFTWVDAMEAVA